MSAQSDPMYELGRAQHCLVHGDVRGAIAIYKTLLEARPDDMRMQERLAALLREDGQLDAARILYLMIARHWKKIGFYLRAVTSYRILVELDPGNLNAKRHLAELYAELHMVERATEVYRLLADTFAAQGNTMRRLVMFERIVELAPDDVETRLLYATELDEHGDAKAANKQLVLLLDVLFQREDWKRYAAIGRRYVERVPDDLAHREALSYAELSLRETASGVKVAVRPSGPTQTLASGERSATSSRLSGARTALSSSRAAKLESLLELPTSAAAAGDFTGDPLVEALTEASILSELASIDAVQAHLSTKAEEPIPRPSTLTPAPLPAVGELGPFSARPFGPSSEVVLQAPGHVVAAALRARKRGDAVMALALLEDEGAAEHPIASAFEKGVALAARQQWGAAMGHLSDLMDADLAPADLALIAYHIGVICEMTQDAMLAQICFERVERLCPGEATDVMGRLERLG